MSEGDGLPVIEHTFWLCPEHAEENAAECTCGLVPYVPKAEVERLRAALAGLLIYARGNQHVLDKIHEALDAR